MKRGQENIKTVIKLQSTWRGFRTRYMIKLLKKSLKLKKKYFLDEEFEETISSTRIYEENKPLVKKEYVFKSTGSKYIGQWNGGFRHGKGLMLW